MMKFYSPQEYCNRADEIFEDISHRVRSVLPDARIEHIGSSSIPGAISKGDLDIFVGVDQPVFGEAVLAVKGLGFYQKEDTLSTPSLRMMITEQYEEDVAIQVVGSGSEFESFLVFRDQLVENPSLVEAYNHLKRQCAGMEPDQYRSVKSDFIQSVLDSA